MSVWIRGRPNSGMRVAAGCLFLALAVFRPAAAQKKGLTLEHIGADSTAWFVLSTLVIGPTEVVLWDGQYHLADAQRVADRIAATGKRLKAIILSHPDHDHYMGTAAIVERFPGTPVYMTAAARELYLGDAQKNFAAEKSRRPQLLPDSVVTPQVLPSLKLTVDGVEIEVIPDLTGDVIKPSNSVLWIPSLRTVLASDVVFSGIHPWLGSSDTASRAAWRQSLKRIAGLKPTVVVAGHKKDINAPDSPALLQWMDAYLVDFDALRATATTPIELAGAMRKKYPDLSSPALMSAGAQRAFAK